MELLNEIRAQRGGRRRKGHDNDDGTAAAAAPSITSIDVETVFAIKLQKFIRGCLCRHRVGMYVQGLIDDLVAAQAQNSGAHLARMNQPKPKHPEDDDGKSDDEQSLGAEDIFDPPRAVEKHPLLAAAKKGAAALSASAAALQAQEDQEAKSGRRNSVQNLTEQDFHKQRLLAFYRKHNPEKLSTVNATLEKYVGREELVLEKLEQKYGDNPTHVWLASYYTEHNPSKLPEVEATLKKYAGREEELFRKLEQKYAGSGSREQNVVPEGPPVATKKSGRDMETSLKLAELHNSTVDNHPADDAKQASSVSDMISKFNSSSGNRNPPSPHVSPVRSVNRNFFNSSLEHEQVKTLAIHEDLLIDHQSFSNIQPKFIDDDDNDDTKPKPTPASSTSPRHSPKKYNYTPSSSLNYTGGAASLAVTRHRVGVRNEIIRDRPKVTTMTKTNNTIATSEQVVHAHAQRVETEIQQLVKDIARIGGNAANKDPSQCTFGALFDDEQVANYYEALVGTLKAAKKQHLIEYKGQFLLKGFNDDVIIRIV